MSNRKKKRKRNNTPRRKRMSRVSRLQSAAHWIKTYTGKDIVRGYAKWYGQDEVCAMVELRMLGIHISDDRLNKAKEKLANKAESRRRLKQRKKQEEIEDLYSDSDDDFYYIAGYTPGGMPYGVTWEEMGKEPPWTED